jgi:hypothetical protein
VRTGSHIHFHDLSQSQSFIVISSCSYISLDRTFLHTVTHTGGQNEGLRRVHSDGANVVGVRLKRCDLLRGVVVIDAQLEVIGT